VVKDVKALFETVVRRQLPSLAALVPKDSYYRYHVMFNYSIQRLSFAAALAHYLETEKLITRSELISKDWLDLAEKPEKGFHVELEDYLGGLILVSNELARLAVNSVTSGDYGRPVRVASFLNDLLSGFRLLNMKNDQLRKKFDSLKYDIKKVEEVVYDLAIR